MHHATIQHMAAIILGIGLKGNSSEDSWIFVKTYIKYWGLGRHWKGSKQLITFTAN